MTQKAFANCGREADIWFDRQRGRCLMSIELTELRERDRFQAVAKIAEHGLVMTTVDDHGCGVVV